MPVWPRLLLARRLPWRKLLTSAVATDICRAGMSLSFFDQVVRDHSQRQPRTRAIGVVFASMSLFIAIGVVIVPGSVIGMAWRERGWSFWAAVKKMRGTS